MTTPYGAGRRTEGSAIVALVLGIAGLLVCPVIPSIPAVIVGNQAKGRIAADPTLDGEGLAQAGVILGWTGIAIGALGIVIGAIAIVIAIATSGAGSGGF